MEFYSSSRTSVASALLLCFCIVLLGVHGGSRKLYIVYLGDVKHGHPDDVVASHHDMLSNVLEGTVDNSMASMVHNYKHGFSGFAAMLTEEQAEQLAELPEVISVLPNRRYTTATTRSWDFLGLGLNSETSSELLRRSNYGEDIIIGIVDSGIWPESRSFSPDGYGPVPSRWKGECQDGVAWNRSNNCNRKIIGARYYNAGLERDQIHQTEYFSPRDALGHGTLVASSAAGSVVEAANFHGLGSGFARGGAPRARIAVHKSIWRSSLPGQQDVASDVTVLAAIDDAIHDGVDVLSLSLTAVENSFGALHAVQKGITVVYAAGNFGPIPHTVANTAPSVITVAASTVDRSFPTVITLGNNRSIVGQSFYYEGKNSSRSTFRSLHNGDSCTADALNGTDLKGKIVLCLSSLELQTEAPFAYFVTAYQRILEGGGSGLIFAQYLTDVTVNCGESIPCVFVDINTGFQIMTYIGPTRSPVAKIEPARSITGKGIVAPKVAAFSSRGPSTQYADIIKPDIAAPGANILAATENSYRFESGTSLDAPHVSGIIALLKAVHPNWSPAALKSAIVTTASVTDENGMPILAEGVPKKIADPFDYGGGHINPNRAFDPGLIYDIDPRDYNYLSCTLTKTSASCSETSVPGYELNLPSISVPNLRHSVTISRTVTNVGEVDAVYHAAIQSPPGVKMDVEPSVLVFNAARKFITFQVKLSPLWKLQGDDTFGSLTWHGGQRTVRIPIAARMTIYDF